MMNNLSVGEFYLRVKTTLPDLSFTDFKELVSAVLPESTNILSTTPLSKSVERKVSKLLNKYQKGTPITYLTKTINFYGYEINVSNKVLIPRVETEQLVDISKELILGNKLAINSILEIGTGSGCIATSLANELEKASITYKYTGIDISQTAIECTNSNLALYSLENKVSTCKASLLKYLKNLNEKRFHYIVSNPPYLTAAQMEALDKYVQKEPAKALFGGKDGLRYFKQILKLAELQNGKAGFMPTLILEADPVIMEALVALFSRTYPLENISVIKDLFGLDRFIVVQAP